MLELTSENGADYLRKHGLVTPGPVDVSELTEGVSNAVLCVETASKKFVLKQSRPQLRTRDPWYSDISRIWRERDAMQLLKPLLPDGTVPEILFSDHDNYVFAMSHV